MRWIQSCKLLTGTDSCGKEACFFLEVFKFLPFDQFSFQDMLLDGDAGGCLGAT